MTSENESKTPEEEAEEEVTASEQPASEEPTGEEAEAKETSDGEKTISDDAAGNEAEAKKAEGKEADVKKKVQVLEEPSIYDEAGKNRASSGRINSKKQQEGSNGADFPAPFFCPITEKVFVDPVVLTDGISYERSTVKGREGAEKAYANPALKAVIDETVEMSGSSVRAGIKRIQCSMRKTFSQVLEKSIIPCEEYHPLPDVYYCPITFSIIHDPVIDSEGNTYERVAVENWIRANGTSPLTRTTSSVESLYPNHAIADLLDIEKGRTEGSIHPSIRKWKEEEPPKATDPELGGSAAPAPSRFPISAEELEREEERRRRQGQFSLAALFFTVVLILLAAAFGGIFTFLCLLAVCFGPACVRDATREPGS
jgi:hypothetical protein